MHVLLLTCNMINRCFCHATQHVLKLRRMLKNRLIDIVRIVDKIRQTNSHVKAIIVYIFQKCTEMKNGLINIPTFPNLLKTSLRYDITRRNFNLCANARIEIAKNLGNVVGEHISQRFFWYLNLRYKNWRKTQEVSNEWTFW